MDNKDYFFENYRMADFYDDYYGRNIEDIPFWVNSCQNANKILEIACGIWENNISNY